MRKWPFLHVLSVIVLAGMPSPSYGTEGGYSFRELISGSVACVEGVVLDQKESPAYTHYKSSENTKLWTWLGPKRVSSFKITQVHFGDFKPGEIISVYSHGGIQKFHSLNSRLVEEGRFVITLVHYGDGYADLGDGQGMWERASLDGKDYLVGSINLWRSYDQFLRSLERARSGEKEEYLSQITKDKARSIAEETLKQSGHDLSLYNRGPEPCFVYNMEEPKFECEDGPHWRITWTGIDPNTAKIRCVVHADTGEFRLRNQPFTEDEVKKAVLLNLKTYKTSRQQWHGIESSDEITIQELEKQAFLKRWDHVVENEQDVDKVMDSRLLGDLTSYPILCRDTA